MGTDHATGQLGYTMYRDEDADPRPRLPGGLDPLTYRLSAVEDLHAWLLAQGDWVPLGAADEKKTPAEGTVEAWGRSPDNPVGGWYGMRPATGAGSACTCRRCSRPSVWPR